MKLANPDLPQQNLQKPFLDFFHEFVEAGQPLALITTLVTEGSTYSKTGIQVLMSVDGRMFGLVSGGCLESDLHMHAVRAIEKGEIEFVTYDLLEEDELFGLAVGCKGKITVSVQPLLPESDYEPFASIARSVVETGSADIAVIIPAQDPESADMEVKYRLCAPQRVVLFGAGPDCKPLLTFASTMGWDVTVVDHRSGHLERLPAGASALICIVDASQVTSNVDLNDFDAAIVMSHNLDRDRSYLEALGNESTPFIGLLGPPHRRERLLGELGENAALIEKRLRGPVGMQIGGRGPEAIALEIVAELQSFFCSKR
jgi:xanthine dehydrogenase accessory factor